jgi:hypothetical protein
MSAKSNSVGQLTTLARLSENVSFFRIQLATWKKKEAAHQIILREIDEYRRQYESVTGLNFSDARIFEIGYGARPIRLFALTSLGLDARGIDLDKPNLTGVFGDIWQVYRTNGFWRFAKTLVRGVLFDKHERSTLDNVLKERGARLNIDSSRFLVGDAGSFRFEPESVDFVYSEEVFQEIPRDSLEKLCRNLSGALSKNGMALITPEVYSGISGGNLVEWYPDSLPQKIKRKTDPWEHLRKRRARADCYLNELRVRDFTEIFSEYFEIASIINRDPDRGRGFLTDEIRAELADYSEEELLSGRWMFVLRKKNQRE